jgi:flagellar protein FlaG
MDSIISNVSLNGTVRDGGTASAPSQPVAKTAESSEGKGSAQRDDTADLNAAKRLAESIQANIKAANISITFSLYGPNNEKVAIKVVDKDTGEVIREIPPEEIQELSTKADEIAGMILNKKV